MLPLPLYRGQWPLPIVFVSDDSGLVDALGGSNAWLATIYANGVAVTGDDFDLAVLHKDVVVSGGHPRHADNTPGARIRGEIS